VWLNESCLGNEQHFSVAARSRPATGKCSFPASPLLASTLRNIGFTNFFVPGDRRPSPPLSLWLRHRFSPPWVGHCLLNTRAPQLTRELQSEGFVMNEL